MALKETSPGRDLAVCNAHILHSADATELYITSPLTEAAGVEDAAEAYEQIAAMLKDRHAWIVQERLFAAPELIEPIMRARTVALGGLDDGVRPTILAAASPVSQFVGIQMHAVGGIARPKVLEASDSVLGRCFEHNGATWLTASGISGPKSASASEQARAAFEKSDELLRSCSADFSALARTWIWMDDILGWYGEFNPVRTQFFRERGLLAAAGQLPASTGIGVSPGGGYRCAIDLFAVWGRSDAIHRHHAAGKQRSAFDYGSAFARAATAITPAGKAVFCSGTAAIDTSGATCHAGDARGQIEMTVQNVMAVFREHGCGSRDVVQSIAYCRTPDVYGQFMSHWHSKLNWPCLVMLGDVCRDDLLFELEATAAPGATRA